MDLLDNNSVYLEEIDSTNNYLKQNSHLWNKTYFIAYTTNQTKGRGTHNRKWLSEKNKDLAFSFIYTSALPKSELPQINLLVGTGIFNALIKFLPHPQKLEIKHPNDILYDHKKLCGILCEYIHTSKKHEVIIIGIGTNVNSTLFPKEIEQTATSLKLITDREHDITVILKQIMYELRLIL